MYKLGIDVGGTNTDAVLIDENLNVAAAVKSPTSEDISSGIMNAVDAVLEQSGVDRAAISQAMLGTTQCTNAIVERKGLAPPSCASAPRPPSAFPRLSTGPKTSPPSAWTAPSSRAGLNTTASAWLPSTKKAAARSSRACAAR